MIAGERPAATVGAMHAGRETYYENARLRGTERGHGSRPVIGMSGARLREEPCESRAAPAVWIVRGGRVGTDALQCSQGDTVPVRLSARRLSLRSAISMASSRACSWFRRGS